MSNKKITIPEGKTFPICSQWENKYYYCMFAPNESYVLRFIDGQLPSFTACADSSVITPENEVIPYSKFIEKSLIFCDMINEKITSHGY